MSRTTSRPRKSWTAVSPRQVTNTCAPDIDGLAASRAGEYDVMIVDRMMPRMDGVTMIQTIRREVSDPVLFLSAWARSTTESWA